MKIKSLVMSSPEHFDVAYAINPHMLGPDGKLNSINRAKARMQWEQLKKSFLAAGLKVEVLAAQKDLLDFVFCANTFFAWEKKGVKKAIIANMHSERRQPEVIVARQWLEQNGFEVEALPTAVKFEAMGDLIWNLEGNSLFMGHGFRTSKEACALLQELIPFPIVPLKLVDERFYHMDTCFFILNRDTVAFVPEAFSREAEAQIRIHFKNCVEISIMEAVDHFAGNGFCPDGENVFLNPGSIHLKRTLRGLDFILHEIDTSEFMKSGGSVFCLKNFIAISE